MLKFVNLVICILMLLFIGVQYNDPDGAMWMAIYGIPAAWAALAFFNKALFQKRVLRTLMLMSILAALAGMVYFWPSASRWWAMDVWWETETAREGMGMMIVVLALLTTRAIARAR